MPLFSEETKVKEKTVTKSEPVAETKHTKMTPLTRENLFVAQKLDPSLCNCFGRAVSTDRGANRTVYFYVENKVLMRKWSKPDDDKDAE